MLHARAARFDVTGNLKNFLIFLGELNKSGKDEKNLTKVHYSCNKLQVFCILEKKLQVSVF